MRLSQLLCKTQKHTPIEAELPSHRLLLRSGLIRRVAAGIYSLTPLAHRALRHIEDIVRQEMEAIGAQELLLPLVQPAELWETSGRYSELDATLARFTDRTGHPMVLAMTHEEVVTDLVGSMVDSYRQLPLLVYQIQTKFRDEARPRAGLIRLREFLMKDAYSFHASQRSLEDVYHTVFHAYERIFERLSLPVLVVQSDTGMMGGLIAHEFMFIAPRGEDTLVVCPACHYAANQEVAKAKKGAASRDAKERDLETSHTPGCKTIADLCDYLGCTPQETLKSVFYAAGKQVVLALIRGDLDVNPQKLSQLLGAEAQTLSAEEAERVGLCVGFAGPVGLHTNAPVLIVADDSVPDCGDLVSGANRPDFHLVGVRYGRDFTADLVGDIALAQAGQPCVECGSPLETRRGIEAANIFQLGTKYSTAMNACFTDENGTSRPLLMGCYGIGLTRLLACIIEHRHDERGIMWPAAVAPYKCHLVVIGKSDAVRAAAEELYSTLGRDEVLFDDRDVSAGVKFMDADLLGMPLRITVGERSLAAGGAELISRRTGETKIVPLAQVPQAVDRAMDTA
ncbi:MAG: proline--tRNA ligase [Limnochordia bacterium]|jgi:prolyl-tRNA synthetase